MDKTKLRKAREFLGWTEKQREELNKNRPTEYADLVRLLDEVWREWQKEWGDEVWLTDKRGMLKKNPGRKEHPFLSGVFVPYHQPSWQLMKKVKRGTVEQEPKTEEQPSSPTPIGETQAIQDRLPYRVITKIKHKDFQPNPN